MNYKRYLVEFDCGADIHGMDVTKAAVRACKGAISHCCMTGINDILNLTDAFNAIKLEIKIAAPYPEKIDINKVKEVLPPYENINIEVVKGGLDVKGLHIESLGEGDNIVIVNAAITVYVDMDMVQCNTVM